MTDEQQLCILAEMLADLDDLDRGRRHRARRRARRRRRPPRCRRPEVRAGHPGSRRVRHLQRGRHARPAAAGPATAQTGSSSKPSPTPRTRSRSAAGKSPACTNVSPQPSTRPAGTLSQGRRDLTAARAALAAAYAMGTRDPCNGCHGARDAAIMAAQAAVEDAETRIADAGSASPSARPPPRSSTRSPPRSPRHSSGSAGSPPTSARSTSSSTRSSGAAGSSPTMPGGSKRRKLTHEREYRGTVTIW